MWVTTQGRTVIGNRSRRYETWARGNRGLFRGRVVVIVEGIIGPGETTICCVKSDRRLRWRSGQKRRDEGLADVGFSDAVIDVLGE